MYVESAVKSAASSLCNWGVDLLLFVCWCVSMFIVCVAAAATFVDNIDATELRGRDSLQFACRLLEVT